MHEHTFTHNTKGFTLVELSIVLIIIGLIVGGVLAGRSLIEAAELQAVISEAEKFKSAIFTFKGKYNSFPGDMPNASSVWPTCDGTPANCNGTGDGVITRLTGSMNQDESIRAWQQLGAANLIAGTYTGVHTVLNQNDISVNVPSSRYSGAGWFIDSFTVSEPGTSSINNLALGRFYASDVNRTYTLTPVAARMIDNKVDDGGPMTGKVRGGHSDKPSSQWGGVANGCALYTTNTYNTASPYDTSILCMPEFLF